MSVGVTAEIKAKVQLVDYIGESVELKKAGTTFKGLCPFHGEKTPSFVVTPGRESWKCFGCGKGGDLFSFVMERDGVDFPEALRRLAPRAGVELSERTTREDARRKRLQEVLEAAIAFYHGVLVDSRHGQRALDYLRGRGFTDETVRTFQLGFAIDDWDVLSRRMIEKRGFREEELEATGLAKRSQRRRGVYDAFRGRIIFPIRDASGGASGLGGRILPDPEADAAGRDRGPKYLNTTGTVLFDKSRTLYLIDRAKGAMRRTGRAIIVEGNTDALMAHQAGFDNVVCSLGTALTPGQVELVTRYAPEIALAYDVDAAGQSAATFGATELTALVGEIERSAHRGRLTDVGVVRLPPGKDPDEVIRDEPGTWRLASEHPQPIIEYLIDRHAARHDPRTVAGRQKLVEALLPTLRTVADPVRRDGYLQLLARRSGVEERTLLESLRRPPPEPSGRPGASGGGHAGRRIDLDAVLSTPGAIDPTAVERTLEPVESTLLRVLLLRPDRQEQLCELAPTDLLTTPARELWLGILRHRGWLDGAERPFEQARFLESLDATTAALARTLYARTDPLPETEEGIDQAIDQCLLSLERRTLSDLFEYRRAELAEAEASGDQDLAESLRQMILALQSTRADLDHRAAASSLLSRFGRREERRTRLAASQMTPATDTSSTSTTRTATPAGGTR